MRKICFMDRTLKHFYILIIFNIIQSPKVLYRVPNNYFIKLKIKFVYFVGSKYVEWDYAAVFDPE